MSQQIVQILGCLENDFPFGQSGLVVIDARNSGASLFPSLCEDTPCKSTTTTQKFRLALIFNR